MRLVTEPGYHVDGKWDIRIESVVIVHGVETPNNFEKSEYLDFERVAMVDFTFCLIAFWDADGRLWVRCPSQTSLIDLSPLTAARWSQ